MTKVFRKMRGISDQDLSVALTNHRNILTGLVSVTTLLLRERRLLLVLQMVEVGALLWMVYRVG